MNRFKCTYWANGIKYIGDIDCDKIEWAIYLWKETKGFERFEDSPYKVN